MPPLKLVHSLFGFDLWFLYFIFALGVDLLDLGAVECVDFFELVSPGTVRCFLFALVWWEVGLAHNKVH